MSEIQTVKTFQKAVAQAYVLFLQRCYGLQVDPAKLSREDKLAAARTVARTIADQIGDGENTIYNFIVEVVDRTDSAEAKG